MYDMYKPLSETDYKFTYEEALAKSEEVLAILGEDYLSRVKTAFQSAGLMFMKIKASAQGAYSGGSYDTNAYMLFNLAGHAG